MCFIYQAQCAQSQKEGGCTDSQVNTNVNVEQKTWKLLHIWVRAHKVLTVLSLTQ
jgi:hypothetical protein